MLTIKIMFKDLLRMLCTYLLQQINTVFQDYHCCQRMFYVYCLHQCFVRGCLA